MQWFHGENEVKLEVTIVPHLLGCSVHDNVGGWCSEDAVEIETAFV